MKQLLLLALSLSIFSCGNASTTNNSESTRVADSLKRDSIAKVTAFEQVYYNRLNQTARFIAGINDDRDSMFVNQRSSEAWKSYNADANTDWQEFLTKNKKMDDWAKANVVERTRKIESVFYPFSGPDFLHLNIFYPNAKELYMLGLEPIGSVPQIDAIADKDIARYVDMYRRSIGEITDISYYRTKSMFKDVNNFSVDGVTPVLMIFLARNNKYLISVDSLTLSEDGQPIVVKDKGRQINRGVKITYRTKEDPNVRQIIFFNGDIEDPALDKNPARKKYIASIACDGGFAKSASYLMHHGSFGTVRNSMLNNCKMIIQDDTGVAYKYFDHNLWNIELYGTYDKPINDFPYISEKALKAAYEEGSMVKGPLDFRFGYNYQSNMRVATRK